MARPGLAPADPDQRPPSTSAPARARRSAVEPRAAQGIARGAPALRRGIPPLAAVAMIGAASLFAAAGVVWLFYRGHGAIEAHASAGADGSDQLELTCAACADGSVLRLDAANATFLAHHATMPLSRPLNVGENPLTLTLVSAKGKQSFVEVSVPIAFRVRGDTSGLDAPKPELRVLINALPGSSASVNGSLVALDAEGAGSYALDVSAELTGLEAAVKTLERRIPYVVTPPNGAAQTGSVNVQAGITPLVIDAPGSAVVLEAPNFVLAGRTAKAGVLTVGDRPVTVDAAGHFAQMMTVSAPGETTMVIRATSKDTAPRLFALRVTRVDSFSREAERVRQRATSSYAVIADQPQSKRGWAVALDGNVVDSRSETYTTVALMDVRGGCARAPCLARLVYGAPFLLAPGDKLSAFGEIAGVVDGPRTGSRIPEIQVDFLIKASK